MIEHKVPIKTHLPLKVLIIFIFFYSTSFSQLIRLEVYLATTNFFIVKIFINYLFRSNEYSIASLLNAKALFAGMVQGVVVQIITFHVLLKNL